MYKGSDAIMDPLKMHYGVKRPLQFKEERIKNLPDSNMRYYPVDVRGNLDEWGAVIKHQSEVHQREQAQAHMQMRHG